MIANGTKLVKLKQVLFLFFLDITGVCKPDWMEKTRMLFLIFIDQDQYFFILKSVIIF